MDLHEVLRIGWLVAAGFLEGMLICQHLCDVLAECAGLTVKEAVSAPAAFGAAHTLDGDGALALADGVGQEGTGVLQALQPRDVALLQRRHEQRQARVVHQRHRRVVASPRVLRVVSQLHTTNGLFLSVL